MLRAGATPITSTPVENTKSSSLSSQITFDAENAATLAEFTSGAKSQLSHPSSVSVSTSSNSNGSGTTLKEHENMMNQKQKEIFNLKMRIYFLEKVVEKNTPKGLQSAVLETCELKEEIERSKSDKQQVDLALVKAYETIEALQSASELNENNLKTLYTNEIGTLVDKLTALQEQSKDLATQNESLTATNTSLSDKISNVEEKFNDSMRQKKNLELLLDECRDKMKEETATLQEKLDSLGQSTRATIEDLRSKNNAFEKELENLRLNQLVLKGDLKKYEELLELKEAENSRLAGEIKVLQSSIDQKNTIISQKSEDIANANTKIVYLTKDLSTHQQTLQQKSSVFSELKSKESQFEKDLAKTQRELENATQDLMHYQQKAERLEEELVDCRRQLQEARVSLASLNGEIVCLKTEHLASCEKITQVDQQKLNSALGELNTLKSKNDEISKENSALEKTKKILDGRISALEQTIESQKKEMAYLQTTFEAATGAKIELEKTIEELKQDLENAKLLMKNDTNEHTSTLTTNFNQQQEVLKNKIEVLSNELQNQKNLSQKLSDEKIRLELTLDQSKADKAFQKQRLYEVFTSMGSPDAVCSHPGSDAIHDGKEEGESLLMMLENISDGENMADILIEFKAALDRLHDTQLQSLLEEASKKLMQMYKGIEGMPRVVAVDAAQGHGSASDARRRLDALFHEIGTLLAEHVAAMCRRLTLAETTLNEKYLEHESVLAQKSVQIAFYAQKIEKYRKILHKKEHFINKALEQLDVINNLPLVFADASSSASAATLAQETSSTW